MSQLSAEDIIGILNLEPLDMEGGYFCQTYRSIETIEPDALPERYKTPKILGTAMASGFEYEARYAVIGWRLI